MKTIITDLFNPKKAEELPFEELCESFVREQVSLYRIKIKITKEGKQTYIPQVRTSFLGYMDLQKRWRNVYGDNFHTVIKSETMEEIFQVIRERIELCLMKFIRKNKNTSYHQVTYDALYPSGFKLKNHKS